jgi:hypothetical protein
VFLKWHGLKKVRKDRAREAGKDSAPTGKRQRADSEGSETSPPPRQLEPPPRETY